MPSGDDTVGRLQPRSWLGSTSLAAIVAAFAAAPPVSAETEVLGLRTGEHAGWTRMVVELSAETDYQVVAKSGSPGLMITIPALAWSDGLADQVRRGISGEGIISRVAAAPDADGRMTQITLDFSQPGTLRRSFILKPMAGKPYRLVVDIDHAPPSLAFALLTEPQSIPRPAPKAPSPPTAAKTVAIREDDWASANVFGPVPEAPPSNGRNGGPERTSGSTGFEVEFSGNIEAELRLFPESAVSPARKDSNLSVSVESRLDIVSPGGNHIFSLVPFVRLDQHDRERTHFDIRELNWTGVFGDLEVRLGVDKVFWGVTESVHLVDIINQDDLIEDIDNEDRLGQPMAALSYDTAIGTFSGFIMPYFRERMFPGPKGRPGTPVPVDRSQTQFQASGENWHADWALRWSHAVGPFDIGIAHFSGTSREPRLLPGVDGDGNPVLVPRYDLIDQTSIDVQATVGALLWKFEGITVDGPLGRHNAFAVGFEYTAFSLLGAGDVGFLAEYLYDDRGALGPSPFADDVFAGLRWSANDTQDTMLLAGAIFDLDTSSRIVNVELSRRIGDDWRISLDARLFSGAPPFDPLFTIRHDDFIQIRFARYF